MSPLPRITIDGKSFLVIQCHDYQFHEPHQYNVMEKYPEEKPEYNHCNGVDAGTAYHIGRSWDAMRHCEDACPCPQEPCGLVSRHTVVDSCDQHPPKAMKTIRQGHMAKDCPGVRPEGDANPVKP